MSSIAGRAPAGDAAHHQLDVTFGTSRGDTPPGAEVAAGQQVSGSAEGAGSRLSAGELCSRLAVVDGKDVVVMAWRGRRARRAGGWRWLRRLGVGVVVAMVGRGLWPRITAGWRWLTGPGWDSKQVEELYGKLTNRGYGGGLVDVVARRESSPVRPQRAAPPERPDAES